MVGSIRQALVISASAGLILAWTTRCSAYQVWGTASDGNEIIRFDSNENYLGQFNALNAYLALVGNEVWATDGDDTVRIFSTNGQSIDSFNTLGQAGDLAVVGNQVWIAGGDSIAHYDFSGDYLSTTNVPDGVSGLGVVGNNVWAVNGGSDVQIFDFSNNSVGSFTDANGGRDVAVVGDEAWIATSSNEIDRFDFSDDYLGSFNAPVEFITTVGNEVWGTGGGTNILTYNYSGDYLGSFSAGTDPPVGIEDMTVVPEPSGWTVLILSPAFALLRPRRRRKCQ
jgi:hypothetical protein